MLQKYDTNVSVKQPLRKSYTESHFNMENLRNAPQSLNLMLKKSKGTQLKNGKWHASFNVKTGKQVHTPVLGRQAEALHAVDILKLQAVPNWAREYVFNHGLNRPA